MGIGGKRRPWAGRLRAAGTSTLAIVVLIAPLAMWVSWSERMFIWVIAIGIGAAALYFALDQAGPATDGQRSAPSRTVSQLDDELVAEVSNLQPFVYHNRLSAEPRPRHSFDKVKKALEDER